MIIAMHIYLYTYIRTTTVIQEASAAPNNANKKVIFKNCVAFTNCVINK